MLKLYPWQIATIKRYRKEFKKDKKFFGGIEWTCWLYDRDEDETYCGTGNTRSEAESARHGIKLESKEGRQIIREAPLMNHSLLSIISNRIIHI
ncbi:MAG TPA: hypothetical protein VHB48_17745 [Chitinophagaceae bacterium]|nr:hypothetical protein [Chitinophagaceae bacterium]